MMSLSQKVAFNTTVQIASKTITVFFSLLTTILLTNYLGKQGFGDYIYVITLVVIFGALADWGTATIGVREAAKESEKQGQILANILILRLLVSFLAALLLVIFGFLAPLQAGQPEVFRQTILIASLVLFFSVLKTSFSLVFQVKLQMQKSALANIVTGVLVFLISWFFVRLGFGLLALIAVYFLATLAGAVVAGWLALKTVKFVFVIDKKFLARFIKESLPMGAILLLFTIDNKIDTVMLGIIKGSGSVGIYGIAYRVYDVLILGAAFLMNALLPVFSKWSDINRWGDRLKKVYQQAFDILFLMGIGMVILIWFFAPLIVQVLTQQKFAEFAEAVKVLRILSIALFLAYFNHLTGFTIVALGKQRPYFFIALGSLVFNIFANLVMIPRFSYYGAATVTILTEGILLLITTIFVYKFLRFVPSLSSFPKTLLTEVIGRVRFKLPS